MVHNTVHLTIACYIFDQQPHDDVCAAGDDGAVVVVAADDGVKMKNLTDIDVDSDYEMVTNYLVKVNCR